MVRSLGFGSINSDICLYQTCFRFGSKNILTKPLPISRRLILQQARGHFKLPLIVSLWFHVLFHSPTGVLFHLSLTVLVRYRSFRSI